MTKAKITAAEREKIEALIRKARRLARALRSQVRVEKARRNHIRVSGLFDDLADVAKRYLKTTANQPDE